MALLNLLLQKETMLKFYGLSDAITLILLIALVILGILAIAGSAITFSFYYPKSEIVPKLYKILALVDSLTGLNAIYFVILCFTYLTNCNTAFYNLMHSTSSIKNKSSEEWAFYLDNATGCQREDQFLIPVSFVVTAVVTRLPLFVGVVLSVVCSINIALPFYRVSSKWIIVSISTWFFIWAGLAIWSTQVATYFEYEYYLKDSFFRLLTSYPLPLEHDYISFWQYLLMTMVGYTFPLVVMLISTILQIWILYNNKIGRSTREQDAVQFQITISIIAITCLALACGLPSTIYIAISWLKEAGYAIDNSQAFLYGFGLPVLNSALNPILLIIRSAKLREHVITGCGRNKKRGTTISTTKITEIPTQLNQLAKVP